MPNFIVTGKFRNKLSKLKLFKSQSHMHCIGVFGYLVLSISLKRRARSSEAFVFANKDILSADPLNLFRFAIFIGSFGHENFTNQ